MYKSDDLVDDIEDRSKSLLDINPEGLLLREIKDISDELNIMLSVKNKQQRVFKQFKKYVEQILAPGLALSKEFGTAKQKKITGDSDSDISASDDHNQSNLSVPVPNRNSNKLEKRPSHQERERDARWTLEFANDVITGLEDRIADLNNLKESAEHTEKAVRLPHRALTNMFTDYTQLDGLLGLKQQQAGVIQARKAVQQTEETLKQGRSIMLFTVITIIFVSGLPLLRDVELNL